MSWDHEAVQRYEAWFETEPGRVAYSLERRLFSRLMADWPRRGQRLLEIGCGPGIFLSAFWEDGFEVTGLDSSPAMLAAARNRLGDRADFHLGSSDHLPFDDKEFDFSVLLTLLEFQDDPLPTLREALRVTRKGILISFLNKWSFYYVSHGSHFRGSDGVLKRATWRTPPAVRAMITQTMGNRPIDMRSVLPGPYFTWRDKLPWRLLNAFVLPYPFGSYCALRVDLINEKPLTPLLARTKEANPSLCR